MKDAAQKTKRVGKGRSKVAENTLPETRGEVTFVRVPIPDASAMNKARPVGCLLQAQLKHVHHAESARLPKAQRDGRMPEDIKTEAEAASYIGAVTRLLHPQRRKRSRAKASS